MTNPYRALPIVRDVPRAVCTDCAHAWRVSGVVVACAIVAQLAADWDKPWAPPVHDGDCASYRPRPWLHLLELIGLRRPPMRYVAEVDDPAVGT